MMQKTSAISHIISPSIRRHMREVSAPSHFLLLLRPGVTKIDFIAVAAADQSPLASLVEGRQALDQAYEDMLAAIKRQSREGSIDLSNTKALFGLCDQLVTEAQQLAPHLNLDEQLVRAVAVCWLEDEALSLGDALDVPAWDHERWRTSRNQQAPLRFQDAIDWYASHQSPTDRAKFARDAEYDEVGLTNNPTVLQVPANRPNIVTLANLKVFLAEHLLAYNRYPSGMQPSSLRSTTHSGLTFFFLPIKGLGQFRAAIDWVGVDGYNMNSAQIKSQLFTQATTLQRLGLESLFTQSLIQSFSTSLRQAFSQIQEEESKSSDAPYQAFADLWWANEVRFYKNRQLQNRLLRSEGEDDTTWIQATNPPSPWNLPWSGYNGSFRGFLATSGKGHPELTYIRLNLSSFASSSNDTNRKINRLLANAALSLRDLGETIEELPFDEVLFACYFFEPLKEDLAEWVDQLGDAVVTVLLEQTIQRTKIIRSRAKTIERLAHWLNGLMRSVGRAGAANNVEAAMKLVADNDVALQLLQEAGNSLQLMVLAEAGTSLFRLYGTIDEGDFAHLRKWFTETSRLEWGMPTAFQKYVQSVTHLARAIGSARGHKRIDIVVNGKKTEYNDGCKLDLDDLRFPPLSKGEKVNEPILALLPALTEPLENALNYLDRKRQLGSETPIRIEIEDLRDTDSAECILINIGNPFFEENDLPERHGLARAQELMKITRLATIDAGERREVDGVPYYFVPVRLHPQRLAERIDRHYEVDDAGCLCL